MKKLPCDNSVAATLAINNGCSPIYSVYYGLFCCGCNDVLHACDQQCSVIDNESARRRREHTNTP